MKSLATKLCFLSYLALYQCSILRENPTITPKNATSIEPKLIEFNNIDVEAQQKELVDNRGAIVVCNNILPISLVGSSFYDPVVVMTPNFPNNYLNNQRCVYSMLVPSGYQVSIDILAFKLECYWDKFTIGFNEGQPYSNLYACDKIPTGYIIGKTTFDYTLNLIFESDISVTFSGFKMNVYLQSTVTLPVPSPCTCGQWPSTLLDVVSPNRIVGGFVAPPHSIPYQVGLTTSGGTSPFCGGTLISLTDVLTAAHCTNGRTASSIRVILNEVNFQNSADGQIYVNVDRITQHPSFNRTTLDYDFSILKLASPAQISSTVNIACLPTNTAELFVGTKFLISGWGSTSYGGFLSSDLKGAYVFGLSNSDCSATGYGTSITNNMICATTNPINTDTCQGDSGGPMVAKINNRHTVVGVTSFGIGCAQPPYPGVYSRVTAQKQWILDNSLAGQCQN